MEEMVAMATLGLAASGASIQISHPFSVSELYFQKVPPGISQSITQMGKQSQREALLRSQFAHGGT